MISFVNIYRLVKSIFTDAISERRAKRVLKQRIAAASIDPKLRVVVYTAIFGGRDSLREATPYENVSYVCFSDDENLRSHNWEIRLIKGSVEAPVRVAKRFKILPHIFFGDFHCSLWVDGSHLPTVDPRYLVTRYLGSEDIALFKHPTRSCVYDEFDACLTYGKDTPHVMREQMRRYQQENYPHNGGLATCTVILRRHSTLVNETMESWWREIEAHSFRDQLSFNYIMRKHQLRYFVLPGNVYVNHYFSFQEHRRPDTSSLRIGWIMNGTRETASSRFLGYNMHDYLRSQGISSEILYAPTARIAPTLTIEVGEVEQLLNVNINVIVLVKLMSGPCLKYLLDRCRKRQIKLMYAFCDTPSPLLLKAADLVVAPAKSYLEIIPGKFHSKVRITFDGFEHDPSFCKVHSASGTLTICLVTNNVSDEVPCIKSLPNQTRLKIIGPNHDILKNSFPQSAVFRKSSFAFDYVPWTAETVILHILSCDVGVIPSAFRTDSVYKSANRLLMFMALGLPVIASPLPSYLGIIRQGENGFIARSAEEWTTYIELLRDSPRLRAEMGSQARKDVMHRFSKDAQGRAILVHLQRSIVGELQ